MSLLLCRYTHSTLRSGIFTIYFRLAVAAVIIHFDRASSHRLIPRLYKLVVEVAIPHTWWGLFFSYLPAFSAAALLGSV